MKKFGIFTVALVLTLSFMTACGCRNSKPMNTSEPTTLPTVTSPVMTEPSTLPTTMPTQSTETTNATIEDGNGPSSTNQTTATGETETGNARSRGNMPGMNGNGRGITG